MAVKLAPTRARACRWQSPAAGRWASAAEADGGHEFLRFRRMMLTHDKRRPALALCLALTEASGTHSCQGSRPVLPSSGKTGELSMGSLPHTTVFCPSNSLANCWASTYASWLERVTAVPALTWSSEATRNGMCNSRLPRAAARQLFIGSTETPRRWVRQAEVAYGARPTGEESAGLRNVRAEVRKLRRANENLDADAACGRHLAGRNRLCRGAAVQVSGQRRGAVPVLLGRHLSHRCLNSCEEPRRRKYSPVGCFR
jgi:hypothetical protein